MSLRNTLRELCSRYIKVHGHFPVHGLLSVILFYTFKFKVIVFRSETLDALNVFGYTSLYR